MKSMLRFGLLCCLCLLLGTGCLAADGETLYNADYCFSVSDFETEGISELSGIFVSQVPDSAIADIRLGSRVICPGDVLPVAALEQLRLSPNTTKSCNAELCYRPICGTVLAGQSVLTIRIQSGKNETPKAIDAELETYKNIPNNGTLSGSDPEDAPLTYQLVEEPKRGKIKLESNGSYVYTPDKNKVGEDSFRFTVTDEAGNVSKPATVKILILKPTQEMSFADMTDATECFEAQWMCEQALAGGRNIGGNLCFCPEEPVSRIEFLVMTMELAGITPSKTQDVALFQDADALPAWQQRYLADAAARGLVRGEASEGGLRFRPKDSVSAQEAAVLLQNLLELPVTVGARETVLPVWSATAVQALSEAGIAVDAQSSTVTRIEAAELFYRVSKLLA